MPKTDADRIEELQDQVYALQQLLLAHILAFDVVDRDATDTALNIALGQSDAAFAGGRPRVTARLGILVEELQKCRD